jgi:8-oxo-dGTP diphosphatase
MPIATVAAIIKNEAGKILLTRRNVDPFKGQWCLPGGHIDDNEKAFDAVIREAKEETGLEF